MIVLSLALSTTAAFAQEFPVKPNPEVTVGDFCDPSDQDFIGYRYEEKIPFCERNVSRHRKDQAYRAYGISENCRREYTVDHFVPLSMGGSNAIENLWPEHKNVKATRQNLEQELYEKLARGEMSQAAVVNQIVDAKMNPPAEIEPSDCH